MTDTTDALIDQAVEIDEDAQEFQDERRRDLALFLRHACKHYDNFSYTTLAKSTLSLRTVNERLIQFDKEQEAADYVAEIRHNTIMLKSGIRLGIIDGSKAHNPTAA